MTRAWVHRKIFYQSAVGMFRPLVNKGSIWSEGKISTNEIVSISLVVFLKAKNQTDV